MQTAYFFTIDKLFGKSHKKLVIQRITTHLFRAPQCATLNHFLIVYEISHFLFGGKFMYTFICNYFLRQNLFGGNYFLWQNLFGANYFLRQNLFGGNYFLWQNLFGGNLR